MNIISKKVDLWQKIRTHYVLKQQVFCPSLQPPLWRWLVYLSSGRLLPRIEKRKKCVATGKGICQWLIIDETKKEKEMNKKNNGSTIANVAKHGYEATVKARALARAGANPHLNGHILEIMGTDKTNLNPINMVRGVHEKLTASTTAKTVDSVVMKGGKVVSRVQYKDTPRGITETIRKVKAGQYNSTTLKGTTETAKKFNDMAEKAGISKRMQDTGISGRTTKALGRACGSCKSVPLSKAVAWSARSGGICGGAISGGISAVSNIAAVINGDKDGWEAAGSIAKDATGGALSGAGAAAAATATGAAVAAGVASTAMAGTAIGAACVVAAPVAVAVGVGCLISSVWNAFWGD